MHSKQKHKLIPKTLLRLRGQLEGLLPAEIIVAAFVGAGVLVGVGSLATHLAESLNHKLHSISGGYSQPLQGEVSDAVDSVRGSSRFSPAQIPAAKAASDAAVAKTAVAKSAPGVAGGSPAITGGGASTGHFKTLPPGSSLPSDASCSSLVRAVAETRPANYAANHAKGVSANDVYPKVTGNFAGSTDEIFQWVACKWGIDEDIVRAQAAKESWWFHRVLGDYTTDPSICAPTHPIGADGLPGQCPESVGILQVRWQYHKEAFENNNALNSTAYNADYTYAIWRDCYEGNMGWLNGVEKGSIYAAGDEWGCVGEWYSGRWHTPDTETYINAVKDYSNQRIWEKSYFLDAT